MLRHDARASLGVGSRHGRDRLGVGQVPRLGALPRDQAGGLQLRACRTVADEATPLQRGPNVSPAWFHAAIIHTRGLESRRAAVSHGRRSRGPVHPNVLDSCGQPLREADKMGRLVAR